MCDCPCHRGQTDEDVQLLHLAFELKALDPKTLLTVQMREHMRAVAANRAQERDGREP